jgi:hypothetical protein
MKLILFALFVVLAVVATYVALVRSQDDSESRGPHPGLRDHMLRFATDEELLANGIDPAERATTRPVTQPATQPGTE